MRQNKNSRVKQHISNMEYVGYSSYIVYALWCPVSKTVRYVGFTDKLPWMRLNTHISPSKADSNKEKSAWVLGLREAGLMPTMRLLASFEDKEAAKLFESDLINRWGAKRTLLNRAGQATDKRRKIW